VLEISTDAHIIAACGQDPERFRELFERHFSAILGFLRRRIGPKIAEDLAIETFALAFRRRESYDSEQTNARPWLPQVLIWASPDPPVQPEPGSSSPTTTRAWTAAAEDARRGVVRLGPR